MRGLSEAAPPLILGKYWKVSCFRYIRTDARFLNAGARQASMSPHMPVVYWYYYFRGEL